MTSPVSYELVDEIGVVTINNPPVNALSQAVRQGIHDAIEAAQSDTSKAVLILCAGRTFIAGADIREFGQDPQEPHLPDLCAEIENSSKLVVAALHGTALGGGFEVALSCHYRCAVKTAKVGLPEVKLGLLPGAGGTQRTPRLTGAMAALDLITSGNPVDAERAASLGLIDHLVDGDLRDAALAWCRHLVAKKAPRRKTSELRVESVSDGVLADYRARLARRARGQVAPQKIIECIEAAMTKPFPRRYGHGEEEIYRVHAKPTVGCDAAHVFCRERSRQAQGSG